VSIELTPVQLKHVQKPYIATLATVRADGSPHTAPVWYRYDTGVFYVLTEGSSVKARNIKRDARVELCIDDRERAPFHTVIVRGRATIEPYPGDAWRLALAVRYLGEEGGRRYVESAPVSADEVLIRIEPDQFVGW
jgi:PPOX class probable F420-dependent enzyme